MANISTISTVDGPLMRDTALTSWLRCRGLTIHVRERSSAIGREASRGEKVKFQTSHVNPLSTSGLQISGGV